MEKAPKDPLLRSLQDESLPFSEDMLIGLILYLQNCDPKKCYDLPAFRIIDLVNQIKQRFTKINTLNEFRMVESVMYLYILCLYFTMSTSLPSDIIFIVIQLFLTINCESLITEYQQNTDGLILQLDNPIETYQKHDDILPQWKLEIFQNALQISRQIFQETYELYRKMNRIKKLRIQERKQKIPRDTPSIQPTSVYYMITVSLSHMTLLASHAGTLSWCLGLGENFLLGMITSKIKYEKGINSEEVIQNIEKSLLLANTDNTITQEQQQQQQDMDSINNVRYYNGTLLLEECKKLCLLVAHNIFTERYLQELMLTKGRLSKHFNHRAIAYAQYSASVWKSILHKDRNPSKPSDDQILISSNTAMDKSNNNSKKGNHWFASIADLQQDLLSSQETDSVSMSIEDQDTLLTSTTATMTTANTAEFHSLDSNKRKDILPEINSNSNKTNSNQNNNVNKMMKKNLLFSTTNTTASIASMSTSANDNSSKQKVIKVASPRSSVETISVTTASVETQQLYSTLKKAFRNPFIVFYALSFRQSPLMKLQDSIKASTNEKHAKQLAQKLIPIDKKASLLSTTMDIMNHGSPTAREEIYMPNYHPAYPMGTPLPKDNLLLTTGLHKIPITKALTILEAHYYQQSKDYFLMSRLMDPTQEIYWIILHIIEYLYNLTIQGQGLCSSLEQEKKYLRKKLYKLRPIEHDNNDHRDNVSSSAGTRMPNLSIQSTNQQIEDLAVSPATTDKKLQKSSSSRSIQQQSPQQPRQQSDRSNISTRKANKKKASGNEAVLDIGERLKRAQQEAQLQCRLTHIEAKLTGNIDFLNPTEKVLAIAEREKERLKAKLTAMLEAEGAESALGLSQATRTTEQQQMKDQDDASMLQSIVWYCPAKVKAQGPQQVFEAFEIDFFKQAADNPLANLPSQTAAIIYAEKLAEDRQRMKQEEEAAKIERTLQQEEIVTRNRLRKAEELRKIRERMKEEMESKQSLKQYWEKEKLRRETEEKFQAKLAAKMKEDAEFHEILRIRQIKAIKEEEAQRAKEEYEMQLEMEKAIIASIVDEQGAIEILRQYREEARMKYLEERRRIIEEREERARQEKKELEEAKRNAVLNSINLAQARIRKGNFLWHNGKFGYYDGVRKSLPEYIEYEDQEGKPYYYDPIYHTTQYRTPADANVHHYIDDERKEYDAIYGEGAYDAYRKDRAFKDAINQYGGYYDANGNWIVVNGYYDEEYNFIEYDGYYDENGKYIKYAKVKGDLSFMV